MGKIIDITEKLSFDDNPKLVVKGKELEVNADAPTVLKVMGIVGDGTGMTAKNVLGIYDLIFSEKSKKEIDKMKLPFGDFVIIVQEAVNAIIGDDKGDGGER